MRQVWIRIGAAAALLISQVALGQDWDFSRAFAAGGSMNGVATANAERTLQTNPNDLNTRARLLGRYSALAKTGDVEARRARLNHIVWLIEHVPDTALLHEQDVMLIPGDLAPPLQAEHDHLSNAWHEQVRQHPENVAILANAGMSLANADFHTVLDIFPRLRELDPANPQWPLSLASAYALAIHEESGDRPASMNASKTFTALQKSNDEQVTGLTGQMLSLAALGGSPVYQVMGKFLIGRAKTLNPGNPRWQRDVTVSLPKQPTASDLAFQVNRITSDYGAEDLRRGPALPAFPANPARVHVTAGCAGGQGAREACARLAKRSQFYRAGSGGFRSDHRAQRDGFAVPPPFGPVLPDQASLGCGGALDVSADGGQWTAGGSGDADQGRLPESACGCSRRTGGRSSWRSPDCCSAYHHLHLRRPRRVRARRLGARRSESAATSLRRRRSREQFRFTRRWPSRPVSRELWC